MSYKDRGGKRSAAMKKNLLAAAVLSAIGIVPAHAFLFDTGDQDVTMRWDNQVRYNLGWRMKDPNPHFANMYGYDETETVFKKHDLIMNRVDLFSEFDYTYKNRYGFRVSAALWSENAYPSKPHTGDLINSTYGGAVLSNYGPSGNWSAFAKRYVTGSSGEFVDAFVFGALDIGSTELSIKAGQHNVFWGESLFYGMEGVAVGQGPSDGLKGQISPGAEAKELSMPINQISASWNLTPELTVQGQYLLDWKPTRAPTGGTFFAAADAIGNMAYSTSMCASVTSTGGCIPSLDAVTPGRKGGDHGLAVRWSPSWASTGVLGFYYRKYDEKVPWSFAQYDRGAPAGAPIAGSHYSYARDTDLFGISFARSISAVATGIELTRRHNTALSSVPGFLAGIQNYPNNAVAWASSQYANIPLNTTPGYSLAEGARGDTTHFLLNGSYLLTQNSLWDAGSIAAELSYQRLNKITKNAFLFNGEGYACSTHYQLGTPLAFNKSDGCATKDALAVSMSFAPQWLQVAPALDVSMPLFLSYGLRGNSPALGGVYEGAYRWSIGLKATYRTVYDFTVQLAGQHQDYKTGTATAANGVAGQTVATTNNAPANGLGNGHTWLNVGFKTSF